MSKAKSTVKASCAGNTLSFLFQTLGHLHLFQEDCLISWHASVTLMKLLCYWSFWHFVANMDVKKKEYIMSVIYTIHKCGVVMEDMLLWGDIIINVDDLSHLDLMYFYNMSPHLSHSLFNYQYKKRTVSCNSHWAPIDVLHLHIVDWNALWFSIVQIFQQYLFHPKNFDMDHSSWFSLSVSN